MKKILFTGFMASILSIAGAYAATSASLTTKGYVDEGLKWAKGAADAAQTAADTAQSGVNTLNNTLKSAAYTESTDYATAAQGELANSAVQPNDNVSTLTNDAGYITSAALPTKVSDLTNDSDFATTTQVATAKSEAITAAGAYADGLANNYATAAQGAKADTALQESDVSALRTTVAGHTTSIDTINTTIEGYGNIVTHNVAEFATSEQGAKADTALQTTDIIDGLTSTSTVDALSANQGKVLNDKITNASTSLTCASGKTCVIVGSAATPVDAALAADWVALTVGQ